VAEDIPGLERFGLMMWDYLRFDFGESYFRSISVVDLVIEKLPVSITLGLWSTVIAYLVSIPLGIRKAVRDGTRFDTFTSGLIIVAYAIPASCSRSCCWCCSRAARISRSSRCGG
jgi:microcin C transport system permease protein